MAKNNNTSDSGPFFGGTISPVTVEAENPWGPYYNALSEEEKLYLQQNPGGTDPISRNIKAKASQGYGIDGNPTFTESTGDMVNEMFLAGPMGAIEALGVPQSLGVEGYEALQGNPYNFADAFPGVGTQRFPSDVMSPDAHWGAKLATDIFTDPLTYVGAGMVDKALGLGVGPSAQRMAQRGIEKGIKEPLGNVAKRVPELSNYIPYSDYMKRMGVSRQDWENFNKLPLKRKQEWIASLQEGYRNPKVPKDQFGLPDWDALGKQAETSFVDNYLNVKNPKVNLSAHIDDPAAEVLANPNTGLVLEKTRGGFQGSRNLEKRKANRQGLFDYLLDPQKSNLSDAEVYNVSYSNPKNWSVMEQPDGTKLTTRGRPSFKGTLDTEDKTLSNISFFEDSKIAAGKAVKDIKETMPKGYTLEEGLLTGDSYSAIMKTMNKAGKKDPNQFTPIFRGEDYKFLDSGKFTPLSKQIQKQEALRDELGTTMRMFRNNNEVDPLTGLPPRVGPGTPLRGRTTQKPFTPEQKNKLNELALKWRDAAQKSQDMAYETYNETRKLYPNANLPELKPPKVGFQKSDAMTTKMVKEGHLLPVLEGGKNYPNVSWKKNYRYGGDIGADIPGVPQYSQGGELPKYLWGTVLNLAAPTILKGIGNLIKGKGLFGNKLSRKERKRLKNQSQYAGIPMGGDPRNPYADPMYGYMNYGPYTGGYRHYGPYGGPGGNNYYTPDMSGYYGMASMGMAPHLKNTNPRVYMEQGGDLPQQAYGPRSPGTPTGTPGTPNSHPFSGGPLGMMRGLYNKTWGNIYGNWNSPGQSPSAPAGSMDWEGYWRSNPHAYSFRGPMYPTAGTMPGSGWGRTYGYQGNYGPTQQYNMGYYKFGGDITPPRYKNGKKEFVVQGGEDKELESNEVHKGPSKMYATQEANGVLTQIGDTDMQLVVGNGKYGSHEVKNEETGHTGVPAVGGEGTPNKKAGFIYSNQTKVSDDVLKKANNLFSGKNFKV